MYEIADFISKGSQLFLPCLSVDCVVFAFHDHTLKVLLLKMKHSDTWSLPGGFVEKQEDVDQAVVRTLHSRTGLSDIFLHQFYLFGSATRSDSKSNASFIKRSKVKHTSNNWLLQRFITVGYYALVEYAKVRAVPDATSEACEWFDVNAAPKLLHDHNAILSKGIDALRIHINHHPIGHQLLQAKFTMPELQTLYEAILGKTIDRRNFQRKMLGYGILTKLNERRIGGAHKSPALYKFDLRNYRKALKEGLKGSW